MTAECMDQSILKTGVVGSAQPPEFTEPWRGAGDRADNSGLASQRART